MSEERGFQVTDRRRFRAEPEPTPEPVEPEESAAAVSEDDDELFEEGDDESLLGGFPQLISVRDMLAMTCAMLDARAWMTLGLRSNPVTHEVRQDLAEAKRAIDAIADLTRHLEPLVEPNAQRDLRFRLSDLRANYVRQQSGG
jgi:hypothetical protein